MRPRERIEKLLDPGTPFLELSSLAANMAYGGESPSASTIVGIGIVSGREVMVRADDPNGERRRLVSADRQEDRPRAGYRDRESPARRPSLRFRRRLSSAPVGGLPRSLHGAAAFSATSRFSRRWASSSSRWCSAIARRAALIFPALSDYNVIVRGSGRGVSRRSAASAGGDRRGGHGGGARRRRNAHERVAASAIIPPPPRRRPSTSAARSSRSGSGRANGSASASRAEEPAYDPQEIYGVLPDDIKKQFDMREIIARIVDGSRFHEYQPNYGTDADLRLSPISGASRSESSPTTACCSTILR